MIKISKDYKNVFTFDFECTTSEPAIPYISSLCSLKDCSYDKVKTVLGWKESIDLVFSLKNRSIVYCHNLKYDISFVLSYLFQNHKDEFIIESVILQNLTKSYFMIDIRFNGKTISFRDSYPLFTAPLSKVMKAYTEYEKGETPLYSNIEDVQITEELFKYSRMDVLGLAIALKERLKYGGGALTTAGGALKEYKKIFKENFKQPFDLFFSPIPIEYEEEMRKAYRGGFTFLNPFFKSKKIKELAQIDVNSMYPNAMYNNILPYGEPDYIEDGEVITDDYYVLGIQKFVIKNAFLKRGYIPFISNSNTLMGVNDYRDCVTEVEEEDKRTFYLTLSEFELFKQSYDYDEISLRGGYRFTGRGDLFKAYIDKFWEMKLSKDEVIKALGKLFLNSLYGKWAEGYEKPNFNIYYEDKIRYEEESIDISEKGYLPLGIFITSYARLQLLTTILKIGVENFVYCDTDSIHYINNPDLSGIPIDDIKLGYWSVKGYYSEGYYIRSKRYGLLNKNGKLELACAGIKKDDLYKQVTKLKEFKEGKCINTIEFKMGINGMYTRPKVIRI